MSQITEIQTILGVTPDGIWGPKSAAALDSVIHPISAVESMGVDSRSEKNIKTLLAPVQPLARQLVTDAATAGITIVVTSGTRTYAEQDELYNKHDGTTHARGGYSNHNFGLAFDVTVFKDGKPVWDGPAYRIVGGIGKNLGLSWGGDWNSIQDEPHFELRPGWANHLSEGAMVAELRRRTAMNLDFLGLV